MKKIILAALLLVGTPALAAEQWTYVGSSDNGSDWYISTGDYQQGRSSDRTAPMWVNTQDQRNSHIAYDHSTNRYTVDCIARRYRLDQATDYYRDGHTDSYRGDGAITYVTPNTIMAMAVDALCSDPTQRLNRT